jgi:hypothetical protein
VDDHGPAQPPFGAPKGWIGDRHVLFALDEYLVGETVIAQRP